MPVSANSGEYKSRVGLDSLYVAQLSADSAAAYTAGTPESLAPAAEASLSPAVNRVTQYADDQPYDTMAGEGETEITLTLTGIPPEMEALLTGATFDSANGRVYDNADPANAPEFALGFRSKKSNGSYRYYWFLKGRFTKPTEDFTTQGDTPDPKTVQLVYTAVKTIHEFEIYCAVTDGVLRVYGDEDTTNFSATGWFTAVQEPTAY